MVLILQLSLLVENVLGRFRLFERFFFIVLIVITELQLCRWLIFPIDNIFAFSFFFAVFAFAEYHSHFFDFFWLVTPGRALVAHLWKVSSIDQVLLLIEL